LIFRQWIQIPKVTVNLRGVSAFLDVNAAALYLWPLGPLLQLTRTVSRDGSWMKVVRQLSRF
jgi:hypothetical protein